MDHRKGSGADPLQHQTDAEAGYAAYGDAVGWVNAAGAPLPEWDDLGGRLQRGWQAMADAVRTRAAHQASVQADAS